MENRAAFLTVQISRLLAAFLLKFPARREGSTEHVGLSLTIASFIARAHDSRIRHQSTVRWTALHPKTASMHGTSYGGVQPTVSSSGALG